MIGKHLTLLLPASQELGQTSLTGNDCCSPSKKCDQILETQAKVTKNNNQTTGTDLGLGLGLGFGLGLGLGLGLE